MEAIIRNGLYAPSANYEAIPVKPWYVNTFGKVPSIYTCNKFVLVDKFLEKYGSNVICTDTTYTVTNPNFVSQTVLDLGEDVVAVLDNAHCSGTNCSKSARIALYFSKDTKESRELVEEVKEYVAENIKPEEKGSLNLICKCSSGFYLREFKINKAEIDFAHHYNADFLGIHQVIMERLNTQHDKGLVLLYGPPGCGKTNYIRYIIGSISAGKNIMYLPPDMAQEISSPDFIPFLIDHPNSVLIIEDAENVLSKRSGGHNQAISNILNVSDGLLSDCLNIQIIATFNTDLNNIDEALLRKGRLIAKYEFGELSGDRAKLLMDKLGIEGEDLKTLAAIYNHRDLEFSSAKNRIGEVLLANKN